MYNTTSNPTEWVDLYGDFLFSYAFSKVRDRVIAQELVQECFLSALKSQESFCEHYQLPVVKELWN